MKVNQHTKCSGQFVEKFGYCPETHTLHRRAHAGLLKLLTITRIRRSHASTNYNTTSDKYVVPPCRWADMYAGRVACCPLVSHGEYADGTNRRQTVTSRFLWESYYVWYSENTTRRTPRPDPTHGTKRNSRTAFGTRFQSCYCSMKVIADRTHVTTVGLKFVHTGCVVLRCRATPQRSRCEGTFSLHQLSWSETWVTCNAVIKR